MVWVIAIWLSVSLALGVLAHAVLAPTGPVAATIFLLPFLLPFLVLGFQERYRAEAASYRLLDIELFAPGRPYRQMTFWGIPVGRERMLTQTAGSDEVSEHVLVMMRAFLPFVLNLAIRRVLPDRRAPEPAVFRRT
jgi:hypothetical protein